ncbi:MULTISPECIES: LuxR C-terminal-related transcriptional regulator [Bacillales]|uniref:LuxR C-terminal-related transcriptional regulator n=1 Tax=Bacillales TaxID=1385 RepID=UPI000345DC3E|nr:MULTISPECIES: LuxR C-terminal-related transcriptional regulator [Bacillales]
MRIDCPAANQDALIKLDKLSTASILDMIFIVTTIAIAGESIIFKTVEIVENGSFNLFLMFSIVDWREYMFNFVEDFRNIDELVISFAKLDPVCINKWEKSMKDMKLDPFLSKFSRILCGDQLEQKLKEKYLVIEYINKELASMLPLMLKNTVFLFTDEDGVVLHITTSARLKKLLNNMNIKRGTLLTMECAGMNAISVAMEVQDHVLICGREHTLNLFSQWTGICSPIRLSNRIVGYLDLAISVNDDISFAVPLLRQLVRHIEEGITASERTCSDQSEKFDEFGISPREKEIASMWLQNKSVLCIAGSLGITEGTVRNVIKKIYRKTGVNDKGQFFRKFLIK